MKYELPVSGSFLIYVYVVYMSIRNKDKNLFKYMKERCGKDLCTQQHGTVGSVFQSTMLRDLKGKQRVFFLKNNYGIHQNVSWIADGSHCLRPLTRRSTEPVLSVTFYEDDILLFFLGPFHIFSYEMFYQQRRSLIQVSRSEDPHRQAQQDSEGGRLLEGRQGEEGEAAKCHLFQTISYRRSRRAPGKIENLFQGTLLVIRCQSNMTYIFCLNIATKEIQRKWKLRSNFFYRDWLILNPNVPPFVFIFPFFIILLLVIFP